MITLNCPDCDQKYELDDSMAGKKAECQCGAMLFIPKTVDVPPGQKNCLACKTLVDEKSVICMECGYNFQTGDRVRTARVVKEDSQKTLFLRRIIKPCILLIIAVVVAIVVYRMLFVKHHGISSSKPMGDFALIAEHLNKCNYVKQDVKNSYVPDFFGKGATVVRWKDVKLEKISKGMFSEVIFVVLSPKNAVLAIGANFKGAVDSIPGDTGSKTGRFMASFWKEVDLPFPPVFKNITKGKGAWLSSYKIAKAKVHDLKGEWMEYPSSISVLPSSNTMIITYSRFTDATYKNVKSKPYEGFNAKSFNKKLDK